MRPRPAHSAGFTLIEIVLVIAIAGFLLIVVFLAVSGAQRARRDTVRKNDAVAFEAAVVQWAANHQLQPPDDTTLPAMMAGAMGNRADPLTGAAYTGDYFNQGAPHDISVPAFGHIDYVQGHICGSDSGTTTIITDPPNFGFYTRKFVVIIGLETGGAYCLDGEY